MRGLLVTDGEWLETPTKILEFSCRIESPLFAMPAGAILRFGGCGIYRRGEKNGYIIV